MNLLQVSSLSPLLLVLGFKPWIKVILLFLLLKDWQEMGVQQLSLSFLLLLIISEINTPSLNMPSSPQKGGRGNPTKFLGFQGQ